MNYLLGIEQLFEKYYEKNKSTIFIIFCALIFLFGFIIGNIVGEYNEMIYLNTVMNDTAYNPQTNNILKTDIGYFSIHPYDMNQKYNISNWTVIPWTNKLP